MYSNQTRPIFLYITSVLTLIMIVILINAGRSDTAGSKSLTPVPFSPEDTCPVKIGDKLPAIHLTSIEKKTIDLNTVIAKNPTVLVFYRGGW